MLAWLVVRRIPVRPDQATRDLDGGESVSQPPLKNRAFSTFFDQNPPFRLRPENGVSPPTKAFKARSGIGGVGVCPRGSRP